MSPETSLSPLCSNWQAARGLLRAHSEPSQAVHSWATWSCRISKRPCIQESKSGRSEWTIFRCISLHHMSNSSSGTISKKGSSALSSSWLWHLYTSYLVPRLSGTKARRNGGQAHSPPNWKRRPKLVAASHISGTGMIWAFNWANEELWTGAKGFSTVRSQKEKSHQYKQNGMSGPLLWPISQCSDKALTNAACVPICTLL